MTKEPDTSQRPIVKASSVLTPSVAASGALIGIFILLSFYTLYLAAPILMPITLAIVMSLVLSPLVNRLTHWHLPRPLAAALVIFCLFGVLSIAIYALSQPAADWIEQAPQNLHQVETKLKQRLQTPLQTLEKAYDQLTQFAGVESHTSAHPGWMQRDSLTRVLITGTPEILGGIGGVLVIFALLFFLLASPGLPRRALYLIPRLDNQRRARRIARALEHEVAIYLMTITLINISLGAIVALALKLLGVPNPLLWGSMVTLLNFAPYVGASISFLVLTFVAILSFDSLLHALMVPLIFLGLAILEGQFITPMLVGKRLNLSPVLVFLSVLIWGWMWGIAGMLLAVPLLACVKIVSERIDALRPLGQFLSS